MDIDAETRLVTLLGDPVAHSLSPRMHNAAFEAQGLNYAYVATAVSTSELPTAVAVRQALSDFGF